MRHAEMVYDRAQASAMQHHTRLEQQDARLRSVETLQETTVRQLQSAQHDYINMRQYAEEYHGRLDAVSENDAKNAV